MPIANGIGFTGYARTMSAAALQEGAPAAFDTPLSFPIRNPLAAQITTIGIGAYADDGDAVEVTIQTPDGVDHDFEVVRAAGAPANATAAAVALAALINADASVVGHVDAEGSGTDLVLTFQHPNVIYPVSHSETGVTVSQTATQAAGGSAIPFGRFLIATGGVIDPTRVGQVVGSEVQAVLPTSATVADDIIGISARPLAQFANQGEALASAVDGIPAGKMGDAFFDGFVAMRNNGAVASAINGIVYVVNDTAGGDELGEARADGGGVQQVATGTPTAANATHFQVTIRVRDQTYVGDFVSDADGTATEIVAGLIADFGGASAIPGVTLSGTTTLIVTGAAGESFTVNDTGVGIIAFVATTAADVYAFPMPRSRVRWAAVVPPGAVGPVSTKLL